jgi:hypothetical protein
MPVPPGHRASSSREVGKLNDEEGKNILMHGYGQVATTSIRNGLPDQLCGVVTLTCRARA